VNNINTIRIETADWLYNAGIVGLVNILESNDIEVIKKDNYIEFDKLALNEFSDMYFTYFIDKYRNYISWNKLVDKENILDTFNIETINEKDISKINDVIELFKNRLSSNSYKSGYIIINDSNVDILKKEKELKKIKLIKEQSVNDIRDIFIKQLELLYEIINYLKREDVKRIICAKNVMYDIIQYFWSKISILHKSNSQKDMYAEYNNYFVNGAITYTENEKDKYSCFICNRGISKLSKPSAFDLTWLNKIGVDMSRKSSHFWNFNSDCYICPICNLVYSCVPAGFKFLKGKGLFINNNQYVGDLIRINRTNKTVFNQANNAEELEHQSYYQIIDYMVQNEVKNAKREIQNIQVVKFDGVNESRPYTFNILSLSIIDILEKHKNRLQSMIKISIKVGKNQYLNLYKEVIKRLYNNQNLFDLIDLLIFLRIGNQFNAMQYIDMLNQINNDILERGKDTK
jgi:CRISPR-associated protein Cst1